MCPARYWSRPHCSFWRSKRQSTITHSRLSWAASVSVETMVVCTNRRAGPFGPAVCLSLILQRRDTTFERRVCGEERGPCGQVVDLHRGERLVARVHELAVGGQSTKRAEHALAAREVCAASVGPVLAMAREPGGDERPENPEHDLQDDDDEEVHPATAAPAIVGAGDHRCDHAREEHHER